MELHHYRHTGGSSTGSSPAAPLSTGLRKEELKLYPILGDPKVVGKVKMVGNQVSRRALRSSVFVFRMNARDEIVRLRTDRQPETHGSKSQGRTRPRQAAENCLTGQGWGRRQGRGSDRKATPPPAWLREECRAWKEPSPR